jgi:hypothetical protein
MNFNRILITDKEDLLEHKDQIFELFHSCFGTELNFEIWKWANFENPNGSPIVSLFYDNNTLIGHYAFIPVLLSNSEQVIKCGLSMTVMVHRSYRRYGVFVEQAKKVYEKASELEFDLVYGFPNLKSAPGVAKRLGWTLDEEYSVCTLKKHEIVHLLDHPKNAAAFSFDVNSEMQLDWRTKKPGYKLKVSNDHLIMKGFGERNDILYVDGDCAQYLNDEEDYNILVKRDNPADGDHFDYVFGYRVLNKSNCPYKFTPQLIMSDVF